jgi:hypothetical protein
MMRKIFLLIFMAVVVSNCVKDNNVSGYYESLLKT